MAQINNMQEPWEGHTGLEVETAIKQEFETVKQTAGDAFNSVIKEDDDANNQVILTFGRLGGHNPVAIAIDKPNDTGVQIFPRVTATLTPQVVRKGSPARLTWKYECIRKEGGTESVIDGDYTSANVVIEARIGSVMVLQETFLAVASSGVFKNLDIPTTATGILTVSVTATGTYDIDGTLVEKTSRVQRSVNVADLQLSADISPDYGLDAGGGHTTGSLSIQVSVLAPKNSTVKLYLDGVEHDSIAVTTNTAITRLMTINAQTMSNLLSGRHNIQLVAVDEGGTLYSDIIYCDFRKAGNNEPYLGIKHIFSPEYAHSIPIGYEGGVETVLLERAERYDERGMELLCAAWTAGSENSTVVASIDGSEVRSYSVGKTAENINLSFPEIGQHQLSVANGASSRVFSVEVYAEGGIESETLDYDHKLTAAGRSNSEPVATRSDWGGITTFSGMDWATNGWMEKDGIPVLHLSNGATAEIDYTPFATGMVDGVAARGFTVEMEIMVSQVTERGASVVSCMRQKSGVPLGLEITTEEARMYFGQRTEIPVPEEDPVLKNVGVEMAIADGKWMKVAFVCEGANDDKAVGGKAFLYINGVLSKGIFRPTEVKQAVPAKITLSSEKADLDVRIVRFYPFPLSSEAELSNFIFDRPTSALRREKHDRNAKSGESAVSMASLIYNGYGVIEVYGRHPEDPTKNIMDYLYSINNKSQDALADKVVWHSPLGAAYDFMATNCYIRIQGTSSVNYPWKNIRFYLNKPSASKFYMRDSGGVFVEQEEKKYALRGNANSIAQAVLCAKTDFVDSSMTLNTGGAIMFHNTMAELEMKTPPMDVDNRVRQAIDGIPCDMFVAREEGQEMQYYGQYNLNNEKSKSGAVFGMEGVDGFTPACPIALETLTNGSPMTLFQPAGSADSPELEAQLMEEFDNGFEFNFPEDVFYNPAKISDPSKESEATAAQKTAVKRWLGWIRDCMEATAGVQGGTMSIDNPDYGSSSGWSDASKAKWVSTKFKTEASSYFNVNYLLTYYIITDYLASVDQRAKNILWRTWDGLKWYPTFYDGDTAEGIRNDAFIAYEYDMTRDTWDAERGKFAFEGHNSWLWCLVLANFEDELKACANAFRNVLPNAALIAAFNETIMANWSERQYNESQWLKYVETAIHGTNNKIHTMTGNREAHRTSFFGDRGELLDARYGTEAYRADTIPMFVGRGVADANDVLHLKSGDLYYYAWRFNNGNWGNSPVRAAIGETATLILAGNIGIGDPVNVCGASRIKEIDFTGMIAGHLVTDINLSKCAILTKLYMPAGVGDASLTGNLSITLGEISKMEYVDLTGQRNITRVGATDAACDMRGQSRLATLLVGGTRFTSVLLPEGSSIETLTLPSTLQTLSLRHLHSLTNAGLTIELPSGETVPTSIKTFEFTDCPQLDILPLFTSWLADIDEEDYAEYRINIENVHWTGVAASTLVKLAEMKSDDPNLQNVRVSGVIELDNNGITAEQKSVLVQKFGDIDSATNALHVIYTNALEVTLSANRIVGGDETASLVATSLDTSKNITVWVDYSNPEQEGTVTVSDEQTTTVNGVKTLTATLSARQVAENVSTTVKVSDGTQVISKSLIVRKQQPITGIAVVGDETVSLPETGDHVIQCTVHPSSYTEHLNLRWDIVSLSPDYYVDDTDESASLFVDANTGDIIAYIPKHTNVLNNALTTTAIIPAKNNLPLFKVRVSQMRGVVAAVSAEVKFYLHAQFEICAIQSYAQDELNYNPFMCVWLYKNNASVREKMELVTNGDGSKGLKLTIDDAKTLSIALPQNVSSIVDDVGLCVESYNGGVFEQTSYLSADFMEGFYFKSFDVPGQLRFDKVCMPKNNTFLSTNPTSHAGSVGTAFIPKNIKNTLIAATLTNLILEGDGYSAITQYGDFPSWVYIIKAINAPYDLVTDFEYEAALCEEYKQIAGYSAYPIRIHPYYNLSHAVAPEINDEGCHILIKSIQAMWEDTRADHIYYTIDGSDPTDEQNPARTEYTGPIPISQDTTVRAYATKAGKGDSIVVTKTVHYNGTHTPLMAIWSTGVQELVVDTGFTTTINKISYHPRVYSIDSYGFIVYNGRVDNPIKGYDAQDNLILSTNVNAWYPPYSVDTNSYLYRSGSALQVNTTTLSQTIDANAIITKVAIIEKANLFCLENTGFELYDNDVLKHRYIPVLHPVYGACAYDTVTHTYATNSGVGNFQYSY